MPRTPSLDKSLLKLLDASAPIYVLDAQRQLVYGNAAFSRWIGRPAQELGRLKCVYTTTGQQTGAAEIASALAPPPEAFATSLTKGHVAAPASDGALTPRPATFLTLHDEQGEANGLVVVVEQASEVPSSIPSTAATSEELHRLLQSQRSELGRRYHIGQLVGQSPALRRVRDQVRLAVESRARVLVVGPEGSGREHVARTIHYGPLGSGQNVGPLVPLEGALLDAELMQSTITSFLRRQMEWKGDRPPALLLLEADKLRSEAQQELAGFLRLPNVQLSLLTTARVPLLKLTEDGKFRQDLAYALSTLTIVLPPLRKRAADVPLLAQFFLEEFNADGGNQLAGFAAEALEVLTAYHWPGNIAELAELVSQACGKATGPLVLAADLPDRLHHAQSQATLQNPKEERIVLDDYLASIETELLKRAMQLSQGNKTKAAELLGIHRTRVIRRLVQLGLAPPTPPVDEEPVVFEPVEDDEQAG